jgi:hypothetical protein
VRLLVRPAADGGISRTQPSSPSPARPAEGSPGASTDEGRRGGSKDGRDTEGVGLRDGATRHRRRRVARRGAEGDEQHRNDVKS